MIDVKALRDPNRPRDEAWGDLQDALDEVERLRAALERTPCKFHEYGNCAELKRTPPCERCAALVGKP